MKEENKKKIDNSKKKKYVKPEIISDDLVAFGALCNGTTSGRRKASTGAPDNCRRSKLNS